MDAVTPGWAHPMRAVIRWRENAQASDHVQIVSTERDAEQLLEAISGCAELTLISSGFTSVQPGMIFRHSRQIRADSSPKSPGGAVPEVCTVTRVARGYVYYRNSTKFLSCTRTEMFGEAVKDWLL